ncbi:MAG: hypothetical protein O2917_00725 [Acidobacteria bacterium]|nr:hypothetical protein [Acidobacteriota bacterium]
MRRPESAAFTYRFGDMWIVSARELPELAVAVATPAVTDECVHIEWGQAPIPSTVDWYHSWGESPVSARFGAAGDGFVVELPDLAVFLLDAAATTVRVMPAPNVPDVTARHLLLNQVLPLMLSHRGRLVLHAGAVATEDGVVGFVGATGAGKSTLVAACAALGAAVVADDSLVLERRSQGWVAIPAYPSIRLWPDAFAQLEIPDGVPSAHYTEKLRVDPATLGWRSATEPLPLARLVLLDDPAREAGRHPVAHDLLSQVFRLDTRDMDASVRLFHRAADLARDVAVTRLSGSVDNRDLFEVAARLLRHPSDVAGTRDLQA